MQPTPPPSGERWNVNMPAVIGVVFVFLVGVVIWVLVTADGSDGDASAVIDGPTTVTSPPVTPTTPPTTATTPPTLSPTPLPPTVPPTSAQPAPTTEPVPPTTQPAPVTTAPGATEGAVPGDLGISGRPMQRPPCDGSYITLLASAIGAQATASGLAAVLDQYPGSNYLRTDQTCPSLTQDVDGDPIYVVFLGPFAFDTDACAARAEGPDGAYARQLSDELGPDHSVSCG